MLPGILAQSASYLGWLHLPLELIDLPPLPNRLTVDGVLKPLDHGLEMRKSSLEVLETLRHRGIPSARVGSDAR